MLNILIATGNTHKYKEIKSILDSASKGRFNVLYLDKSYPVDIVENGANYHENAKLKTDGYRDFINKDASLKSGLNLDYIIAEDSGLEVACLGNAPGLYTARYAGDNATDAENIEKLLSEMKSNKSCSGQGSRIAKFVCFACAYDVKANEYGYFEGGLDGIISEEVSGANGFGYDPVFFIPRYGKTAAEIDESVKNSISHRAIAFSKIAMALREVRNGK